jgi:YVTN family beta-propeller protein
MLTSRPLLCVFVCGFVIGAGCGSAVEPQPDPTTHPSGDDVTFLELSGRPHGVAVAAGGLFYVSRIDDASIMRGRLDGSGQSFQGAADVDLTPAHVALDPAGRRAYSANQFASSASVVDVASNRAIATIPLSGEGFNVLVSPSGDRVFV